MTLITPKQAASDHEELLASVLQSLRLLRRELEALSIQARDGGDINATDFSRTVARAPILVEHCQKAEMRLADCRKREIGIAQGEYALDFERARLEIGCKLDRLRCAEGPDEVH